MNFKKREFFRNFINNSNKNKIKTCIKIIKKRFLNISSLKLKTIFKFIDKFGKRVFKNNKLSRIKKKLFFYLKSLIFF